MTLGQAGGPIAPGQFKPISRMIKARETNRLCVHPGSPGNHQARFIRLHCQEMSNARTGHFCPYDMFGFLQWRNHAQVGAWRDSAKILREKIRGKINSYISIFNLNRNIVLEMNQEHMADFRSGRNMQQVRNVRFYATCFQIENARSVHVSPQLNLVGNISHFKYMRRCHQIRYKRPDTGYAVYVPLVIQFAQRPICRHA